MTIPDQPITVSLDRWAPGHADQERYLQVARSLTGADGAEWRLESAPGGVAGFSRAWLVRTPSAEGSPGWIATNGYLTVHGPGADPGALPWAGGAPPATLVSQQVLDVEETLRLGGTWTTAMLLLDELAGIPVGPPSVRTILRFSFGRTRELLSHFGVLEGRVRRVSGLRRPYCSSDRAQRDRWRAFVAADVTRALTRSPEHPVTALLAPLVAHGSTERDDTVIQAEVDQRVRAVAATSAVAGIVFGAGLSSASASGWVGLALLVAVIAGLSLALVARDLGDELLARRRFRRRASSDPPGRALTDLVRRVGAEGATVLVHHRLGLTDFSCGAMLWSESLARCGDGALLSEPQRESGRPVIVLGGPLVRAETPWEPICDIRIRDPLYRRWAYAADGAPLIDSSPDESIGCVSLAREDADVLFVSGFRDARSGLRWILEHLDSDGVASRSGEPWVLARAGTFAGR